MRGFLVVAMLVAIGCDAGSIESSRDEPLASSGETSIVVLTDAAAAAVRKFGSADESANVLEVSVTFDDPTACTGFRYNLSLIANPSSADFELGESNGIDIAVDANSVKFLRGTRIDWVPLSEGSEGFYFHNPNSDDPMPERVREYYEAKEKRE